MTADNVALAKSLYAAFAEGDYATVLNSFAEQIEWTQPGSTPLSGVHRGRDAVAEFFIALLPYGLQVEALGFFADGEQVVALTRVSLAGMQATEADVLTIRDGAIVAVEHIGDTEMLTCALAEPAA